MSTNKLALLAAVSVALAALSVCAQSEPRDPPVGSPPPGRPHARFGQVLQRVLNQHDANQDGQLDATEMASLQQAITQGRIESPGPTGATPHAQRGPRGALPREILDDYDLNRDGSLDNTERAALPEAVQDGKIVPPHVGRGQLGPRGSAPTAQQILRRFDTDKDGKLAEAELTAFLKNHPPRGPLHRWGRPPGESP